MKLVSDFCVILIDQNDLPVCSKFKSQLLRKLKQTSINDLTRSTILSEKDLHMKISPEILVKMLLTDGKNKQNT